MSHSHDGQNQYRSSLPVNPVSSLETDEPILRLLQAGIPVRAAVRVPGTRLAADWEPARGLIVPLGFSGPENGAHVHEGYSPRGWLPELPGWMFSEPLSGEVMAL